jgi:hypothetical protein
MAGKPGRSGPPGNKNAIRHGLHAYKAMLNGDGLDERTSLFKALREKEQELITALGGDPSPARTGDHRRQREEYALHRQPG